MMSGLSNRFIAVSAGIKERLLQQGVPAGKIEIIPHGIFLPSRNKQLDLPEFKKTLGIRNSSIVVAIVGRMVPVKNHDLFLKAAQEVLKNNPDVQILIVGDGYLREKLEQLSKTLGIDDAVIFTGWRNDMDLIYQIIDILVLCSSTESQGLVLLEAMAHLKAVIATDVDEIKKTVIHEKTGIIIPPGDINAIAKSIRRLIDDPLLRKRVGGEGRKFAEKNYSVKTMSDRMLHFYNTFLQIERPF